MVRQMLRLRSMVMVVGGVLLAFGGALPTSAAGAGVAAMSAGSNHACAVRTDRTVWCWGDASVGQLGDGTFGDGGSQIRSTPVQVLRGSRSLEGVVKVAAGGSHTCAIRDDARVLCWGNASTGQLGNGQSGPGMNRPTAVIVRRGTRHLTGAVQVAAGGLHSCVLRSDRSVWCWGDDTYGQLGDGTTGDGNHVRSTAVRVRRGSGYLEDAVSIAAGSAHTCAVTRDGSAWCWGAGNAGQLGDAASGPMHHRTKAARVRRGSGYLTKVSGIAAEYLHTCARRTDGSAWCWGYGEHGQLGDGQVPKLNQIRTKPVQVLRGSSVLTGVTGIAAGAGHSCARRRDATAVCWGYDVSGQLGDGTTGDPDRHLRLKAVRVVRTSGPLTGVRQLDAGDSYTCALRTDKAVWCWGSNSSGQHGRGTNDDDPHPYPRRVLFPGLS